MGLIGTLNSAVTGNIISSADYNENMNAIRTAFNDSAVLMDQARTIVAVHTFSPAAAGPPFVLGANAQGQLVSGLNADRLDGEHGAFYRALSNATGSLPWGQVSGVTLSDAQHGNRGGGSLHAAVVAGGASGFMTGADKTKLNGIAAGAQVNTVFSVFGRSGSVVAQSGDYSFGQISGTAAKSQVPSAVAYKDEANTFGPNQTFSGNISIGGEITGFIEEQTLDLSADPNFTAGSIKVSKVGGSVILTVDVAGSHSSASTVSTAVGFLPSAFRPGSTRNALYLVGFGVGVNFRIANIQIDPNGSLIFEYWRGDDGTNVTNTATGTGSISYNV